ncbi:hypothetical protein TcWFU_000896 [Taenia crassiceps]|uniref:Uncharacterized protein n=1 Tax=Taenia crassiceps TaxID=6207 RepID=A0ABR4QNS6_9CEST
MQSDVGGGSDEDLCSDFSSGDELLQQALPVDDHDGDNPPDPSKILLCPNEYLRHVRIRTNDCGGGYTGSFSRFF